MFGFTEIRSHCMSASSIPSLLQGLLSVRNPRGISGKIVVRLRQRHSSCLQIGTVPRLYWRAYSINAAAAITPGHRFEIDLALHALEIALDQFQDFQRG